MDDKLKNALDYVDEELATAVLNEAKTGGFLDEDIPEDPSEKIEASKYWIEQAYLCYYEQNMRQPTIFTILNISGLAPTPEVAGPTPTKVHYDEIELAYPGVTGTQGASGATNPAHGLDGHDGPKGPRGEVGNTGIAELRGLPIPKDFDETPQDMPADIHELTDKDVRRLSGAYNAYLARVKWLLALEIGKVQNATHLRDHAYRAALKKVEKVDKKTDKSKLAQVIDAEAREDEEFARLDVAVLNHQDRVVQFKALVDIYSGNIDRLSREWTFRQNEWEKSR